MATMARGLVHFERFEECCLAVMFHMCRCGRAVSNEWCIRVDLFENVLGLKGVGEVHVKYTHRFNGISWKSSSVRLCQESNRFSLTTVSFRVLVTKCKVLNSYARLVSSCDTES